MAVVPEVLESLCIPGGSGWGLKLQAHMANSHPSATQIQRFEEITTDYKEAHIVPLGLASNSSK